MLLTRRKFLGSAVGIGALAGFGKLSAKTEDIWGGIRKHLFQERNLLDGGELIKIDIAERPVNGGDVPIRIIPSHPQSADRFIRKHYLVIDENPSPVAGAFSLSPRNGSADIETRIRINAYSQVRVISETNDGKLYMNSTFVKASGGCSAPPMKEDPMEKLLMGKMDMIRQEGASTEGGADRFLLKITHPNYSGLQKDQQTLYFIPPHYIESVEIKDGEGGMVLAIQGDISFSQNPSFSFSCVNRGAHDTLSVKAVDSRRKIYETEWRPVS